MLYLLPFSFSTFSFATLVFRSPAVSLHLFISALIYIMLLFHPSLNLAPSSPRFLTLDCVFHLRLSHAIGIVVSFWCGRTKSYCNYAIETLDFKETIYFNKLTNKRFFRSFYINFNKFIRDWSEKCIQWWFNVMLLFETR